jgi:hypothetical protein
MSEIVILQIDTEVSMRNDSTTKHKGLIHVPNACSCLRQR